MIKTYAILKEVTNIENETKFIERLGIREKLKEWANILEGISDYMEDNSELDEIENYSSGYVPYDLGDMATVFRKLEEKIELEVGGYDAEESYITIYDDGQRYDVDRIDKGQLTRLMLKESDSSQVTLALDYLKEITNNEDLTEEYKAITEVLYAQLDESCEVKIGNYRIIKESGKRIIK